MIDDNFFSISEFAEFSRTTRDTLLYYDKIGLLSPAFRKDNNYRYYSIGQLAVINLIRTYQALGMSLDQIKDLKDERTPELVSETLTAHIEEIEKKIDYWVRARKLLITLDKTIRPALNVDEESITIQKLPAEAIVLGDLNDYSRDKTDYDALHTFYHFMTEKYPDIDLNYSVWGLFSEERIKKGDWIWPDHFYFYNPDGKDRRPAGFYAVGYTRGGYGESGDLYQRMIEYIDEKGYEICGDAYEEYPLNEVCVQEAGQYLMRVMIMVREKQTS